MVWRHNTSLLVNHNSSNNDDDDNINNNNNHNNGNSSIGVQHDHSSRCKKNRECKDSRRDVKFISHWWWSFIQVSFFTYLACGLEIDNQGHRKEVSKMLIYFVTRSDQDEIYF